MEPETPQDDELDLVLDRRDEARLGEFEKELPRAIPFVPRCAEPES